MTRITIRFTDEQEKIIKKKAKIKNMNTSDYIKFCLFDKNKNEQIKFNNDDINNNITQANTNIVKSYNILNGKLSSLEIQINTILYFILLLIKLLIPAKFEDAKRLLASARFNAEKEQKNKNENKDENKK
jgi:hypothetical protein